MCTAKAPATGLSTLHSMAFGLAVYASPGGLPRPDARLASSRWSDATGRAFTRRAPTKGFRMCRYTSFPLPELCLAQSHRPAHASVGVSGECHKLKDCTVEYELPDGEETSHFGSSNSTLNP